MSWEDDYWSSQIARSAAWMDTIRPRWYDEINIERLDLASTRRCVLGQTIGWNRGYSKIPSHLSGFCDNIELPHWINEIERRRVPVWLTAPEIPPARPPYQVTCHQPHRRRRRILGRHRVAA